MADKATAPKGRIGRLSKGNKDRTMMHAAVANEVIDAVNEHDPIVKATRAAKVSPAGAGEFKWSDANMMLVLKGYGTPGVVTGAVNGVAATATIPFIIAWKAI